MVTAGTLHKVHVFRGDERLQVLQDMLLQTMSAVGLELHAWAVFSNHYHVIVQVPENVEALRSAVRRLHSTTAREINVRDNTPGRQVWFQYWDTCLTYENSYFARLNYVHHNAVHHRLVPTATAYPYCSAASFERRAEPGFRRKVQSFRFDRVRVIDDF